MNNNVENAFSGFPKVKWLHLTDEVEKSVRWSCHIFSAFTYQKLLKSANFWQSCLKIKKVNVLGGHSLVVVWTCRLRALDRLLGMSVSLKLWGWKYRSIRQEMRLSRSLQLQTCEHAKPCDIYVSRLCFHRIFSETTRWVSLPSLHCVNWLDI